MKPKLKQLLNEVEEGLKDVFGKKLIDIILFGSYAREEWEPQSDIDILALVDEQKIKRYDKQVLAINVNLSIKYDIDLSIFTASNTDYQQNLAVIPLYKNIHREGKSIYAA